MMYGCRIGSCSKLPMLARGIGSRLLDGSDTDSSDVCARVQTFSATTMTDQDTQESEHSIGFAPATYENQSSRKPIRGGP